MKDKTFRAYKPKVMKLNEVNGSQAPYTRTSDDGKGVNTKQLLLDS